MIVKPETVVAWHRRGFRLWWAWKSRRRLGRPTVPGDVRTLIRTMSQANPRWGAPRIHGELLKLGLDVSETTVAKYMVRPRQPCSQTWRTFLRNHLGQTMRPSSSWSPPRPIACCSSWCSSPSATHPVWGGHHATNGGVATQQLREAFPWDEAPRYLIHDRDHAFDGFKATAKAMGIEEGVTAPHAPWQNPFVERFVGSARRECFDHVIAFNEAGVRKLTRHYGSYYERPGLTVLSATTSIRGRGGCDEMHDVTADRGRLAVCVGFDGRGPGADANGTELRHADRSAVTDAEA
jgi:hypothetical protein